MCTYRLVNHHHLTFLLKNKILSNYFIDLLNSHLYTLVFKNRMIMYILCTVLKHNAKHEVYIKTNLIILLIW